MKIWPHFIGTAFVLGTALIVPVAVLQTPGLAQTAANTENSQTVTTDWAKITTPKSVLSGADFDVTVELLQPQNGMKLQPNLHWSKPDGVYGGFLAWGGEPFDTQGKTTFTKTFKAPVKADAGFILPHFYLSPDGSFEKNVKAAYGAKIALGATAPAAVAANNAPGETLTIATDWAKITVPKSVANGANFEVKVELLGDVTPGTKLQVNTFWNKPGGEFGGFLAWGGPFQELGEKRVFTSTQKANFKDGEGFISANVFLSPTGSWDDHTKSTFSENIALAGGAAAPTPQVAAVGELQTVTTSWAKITAPKSVLPGANFDVTVELLQPQDGMKLQPNLHWSKPDGIYGGFLEWGGNAFDTQGKTTFTKTFKATTKPEVGYILPHFYLSPDGSFEKSVKADYGAKIMVGNGAASAVTTSAAPATNGAPAKATFKKSWLAIGPGHKGPNSSPGEGWVEGDEWIVPVEYFVDPSDSWGTTKLRLDVHGPWVDNPDGKYTTERNHQNYGLTGDIQVAKIGEKVSTEFKFVIPKTQQAKADGRVGDGILLVASFVGADNQSWPWEVRSPGPWFTRKGGFFELQAEAPGHLFTYGQPIVLNAVLKSDALAQKTPHELKYTIWDTAGKQIGGSTIAFTPQSAGQKVAIPFVIKAKGTFLIEATVDGWETRRTTFARIPDLLTLTQNSKTRFGATNIVGTDFDARADEEMKVARRLGLTFNREFFSWNAVEPAPNVWRRLDEYDKSLDLAKKNGIDVQILFDTPPPWAIDAPAETFHYTAFPFHDADVQRSITTLAQRFKGKIAAFEWLNEIVPGSISPDPVKDYIRFTKIATAASKAVDPNVQTLLAGGLWPRSFRQAVLAGGIAKNVDVLPVHYSNSDGVIQARRDLDGVGSPKVHVWDDETAFGASTWNMPLREAIQIQSQSDYVMNQWSSALMGGAEKIVYFGGGGDAAGNWSYLWDDLTPRPVAATLAVFISKTFDAKPVGTFVWGGALLRLFERPGNKALLVANSTKAGGETIGLPASGTPLIVTDNQGTSTQLPDFNLHLDKNFVFVEGGSLDALKAFVVPQLQMDGEESLSAPHFQQLRGSSDGQIPVRLQNVYDREMKGTLGVQLPTGWATTTAKPFTLAPRSSQIVNLTLPQPPANATETVDGQVKATFLGASLPTVEKPFSLGLIAPELLGNLLKNGGFETPGGAAGADWGGDKGIRTAFTDPDLGHGGSVLRFGDTNGGYSSVWQTRDLSRGGTYLYSAWVKNEGIPAGSNVNLTLADGSKQNFYDVQVFRSANSQPEWEMISAKITTSGALKNFTAAPVVKGNGYALFDNLQLTPYEGTDYAALAPQSTALPTIDGNLADWDKTNPIPLIGRNQLGNVKDGYNWTPANLSGVAYLKWDANNLYLAVEVRDDVHRPQSNENATLGDSLVLALHPANRLAGEDAKAFEFDLSTANPGGSGKHTLFRPALHSGGLKSGSLAKDSSLYDIAIQRTGNLTTYEVRLPFSDLGGIRGALGSKFGASLQLRDDDGTGVAASMQWGGGLTPVWNPTDFGTITLVP